MNKPSAIIQAAVSSLIGLITLNGAMLGALFAQVAPNPPGRFGPYISATLALAAVSLPLVYWRNKIGYIGSIAAAMMCLLSVGPQKFLIEPSAALLSPVIILGSILCMLLMISSIMAWRKDDRQLYESQ